MANKETKLPEEWEEMYEFERFMWLRKNFGTDQYDEDENVIYDTENMSDEILEAYKSVILGRREMKKQGYLVD